ncbi:arsenate reductase [Companilactobacillus kimchiensis]|uniref:Arsenate reductase n=2 Tax=Companilactobacillus kimchiensis TaxID=993692 RepID=A0A0R2L542_9LACO|nr:arsenate reductase [Companilactobacillus kimchiensis]
MAEGFAKELFDKNWEIASAGIEAHGVNPLAIKVMNEAGIDISQNASKLIDNNYLNKCELVVTLCGDARDRCPMTPTTVKRIHWPLQDPALAIGNESERLVVFRNVRDEIQKKVIDLARELTSK